MSVCIVTPNDYSVATGGGVSRVPQCYLPDQMTILTPHPITWAALTLEFLWKWTNVLGSVLRRRCNWDTSEDWWLLACKTWEWIWDSGIVMPGWWLQERFKDPDYQVISIAEVWDTKWVEDQVYMAEMLMQEKVPAMLAADRVFHVFMLGEEY